MSTPQPSTPPDAASESVATSRRNAKLPMWLVPGIVILGGAFWYFAPKSVPKESPLEPRPATSTVAVPPERTAFAPKPAASSASTAAALALTAAPVAQAASGAASAVAVAGVDPSTAPAAQSPAQDLMSMLRSAVDALILRTDAVEQHDRLHETQIAELRADLQALKATQQGKSDAAKVSHNLSHGRSRSTHYAAARTAKPKPAPVATVPSEQGALLAVDLWAGKPSVVLSRTSPSGTELRFFNEGETSGHVTVKQADVATQRAMFATPTGEFTLAPKER